MVTPRGLPTETQQNSQMAIKVRWPHDEILALKPR